MTDSQRRCYEEGLHQVHLELDPEVEALRDRVRELEAENESLGVTQDQHRAANVRLLTSVMESDGRWKDLSQRYDELQARLRTAEEENEQLHRAQEIRVKTVRSLNAQLRTAREENERQHQAQANADEAEAEVERLEALVGTLSGENFRQLAHLRTARGALEFYSAASTWCHGVAWANPHNCVMDNGRRAKDALRDMGDVMEGGDDGTDVGMAVGDTTGAEASVPDDAGVDLPTRPQVVQEPPVASCPVCEGCGKPVASGDGHCLWEDGKRTCPTCQRKRLDADCPDERSGYDDADGWSGGEVAEKKSPAWLPSKIKCGHCGDVCPRTESGFYKDGWKCSCGRIQTRPALAARGEDYERGFDDGLEAPCPGCAAARKRLAQIADQVEMEPIRTSGYNYQRIDALEAKLNELIDCLRQGMELVDLRAIAEVCEGVVSRSDADRERRAEPVEPDATEGQDG